MVTQGRRYSCGAGLKCTNNIAPSSSMTATSFLKTSEAKSLHNHVLSRCTQTSDCFSGVLRWVIYINSLFASEIISLSILSAT